jgi:hypothetical protein
MCSMALVEATANSIVSQSAADKQITPGHRITPIRTTPLALSQLTRAAHKQLRHRRQSLRDRRGPIPRRLTHHLDEIHIGHALG